MASGHVNRIKRPNTWLHRPMLQNVKKLLPNRSRPHMARNGYADSAAQCPLSGQSGKHLLALSFSGFDPLPTCEAIRHR